MNRLHDKVAVVTGGASGFGGGIVDVFSREGAKIVIADIALENAVTKANEINRNNGTAVAVEVDVTDSQASKDLVETTIKRFGKIDIFVANAGLGQRPCSLEQTSDDEFQRQFDVNVKGVFFNCKAVIPQFRRQGNGNIIITASGIALRPRPNLVVYGATKGAIMNFAKGLALELAGDGIRVNALCPGPGDTPMLAEFMGGQETSEGREQFRANLPLGKLIRPQDMGEAALFFADDNASSRLTGVMLPVDSGRTV